LRQSDSEHHATKLPEPPELKRTDDFCNRSIHASVGSNWWRSLRIWRGGWLKSHMPSSASAETESEQASKAEKTFFVMARR